MGSALARTFVTRIVVAAAAGALALGCRSDRTPEPAAAGIPRGGEIVASLRSEPGNYNRYFEARAAAELLSILTHAKLARVNRASDELEPALAESWTTSDGLSYTLKLRQNVKFSDGVPFTSADVVFSAMAAEAPGSVVGSYLRVAGKPVTFAAVDSHTVTMVFPQPFAPALRILDHFPILPRHKLQAAYDGGTLREAWTPARPVTEVTGLGPFVLAEHVSGQRLVLTRNPHYWARNDKGEPLPYLDRITIPIIPDQSAEALRLESGAVDVMVNGDIAPNDYSRFRRLADEGRLQLLDGGVSLDPNLLWFNLQPATATRKPWMHRREFRQALSHAVNRQALADTVYLGAAVPVYGPITPRNGTWFSSTAPTYPHDPAKARELLASAGLRDANGDGMLDDRAGPVRFSVLVQQGHAIRERTVSVLQEQFRAVGVGLDIVSLDLGSIVQRWFKGDYESVFHGFEGSATDPALNLDFWLSSGPQHFWNRAQARPATPWEARIDELMHEQASAPTLAERQRLFAEVQRIFAVELPALYFVAPKVTLAASTRLRNLQPAPQIPQLLWAADRMAVAAPAR